VPAHGGAVVLLGIRVSEQERQLERLREPDEAELGGGGESLRDVPAIECATEAAVRRAL
jgi:hypothetical protein